MEEKSSIDSLNKRYFFKILSKLITAPLTLIVQAILPRGLGPEVYGKHTFQTNIFQQVISFFDSGTTLAFYTGLSKNLQDKSIIRFYGGYSVIASIIVLITTSLIFLFNQNQSVFPGQEALYIFMTIFFIIITFLKNKCSHFSQVRFGHSNKFILSWLSFIILFF